MATSWDREMIKRKSVTTFTGNINAPYDWARNRDGKADTIGRFMIVILPMLINVTRKEIETLAKRWIREDKPHWNANTRKVKASCVFSFMVKHGNLVETGSKLVA